MSLGASPAKAQHADTAFLVREVTKNYYYAIYIDKNRQSSNYTRLLNFIMDKDERDGYKEALESLKSHEAVKTRVLAGLAKEWMPLYRYKGKYYIYSPSEWGYIDRRILTDSTIVYWSMESPTPSPFQIVKRINTKTYFIQTKFLYLEDDPVSKLTIHIIDVKNNIAIWEYISPKGHKRYGLYVAIQSARNFDMIVNYCKENKQPEFKFDKIDYPALLKGR